MLGAIWKNFLALLLRRPARFQAAALVYRREAGRLELLLITSLTTGRWILPKGWPEVGLESSGVALQEAWEEAGVRPAEDRAPVKIGLYRYDKKLEGGAPMRTEVHVYAIPVKKLLDDFPEAGRRERRWVTPGAAAGMVHEPELKALLRRLPDLLGS
ncbi:NUDIX hydrolase [Neomegalonema perideroedes]|uniref:NUDIX hydrolase n=1 Tax=Neomegalonema perideroedes TaxID=217219 RepID=UPI00036A6EF6|nr:NUDIX hydrolase [Neomegalonema perideroedes]